jgi:N-glycosylase/DNA lyase
MAEIVHRRAGARAPDTAVAVPEPRAGIGHRAEEEAEEAQKMLMSICGVGPKVASCALLFGFHKLEFFPIDVWIKRVLAKYYPDGIDISSLGAYAGVAQQYLFYYERYMGGEE